MTYRRDGEPQLGPVDAGATTRAELAQGDFTGGGTRRDAKEEAQLALAGAVAHLETVAQLLADWNADDQWKGTRERTPEAFAKVARWDAVYQRSETVLRQLLELTAAVDALHEEES